MLDVCVKALTTHSPCAFHLPSRPFRVGAPRNPVRRYASEAQGKGVGDLRRVACTIRTASRCLKLSNQREDKARCIASDLKAGRHQISAN